MRNKFLFFAALMCVPSFYSFSALQFYVGGGVVSSHSGFKVGDSTTGTTAAVTFGKAVSDKINTAPGVVDKPISTNPLQSNFVNGQIFAGLNFNFDGFLVGAELIGHSFNADHSINGFAHDSGVCYYNGTSTSATLLSDSIPSRLSVTLKNKASIDLDLRLGYQLSEAVRLFAKGGVGMSFSTLHVHQQYDKQTSAGNNDGELTNPYRIMVNNVVKNATQKLNSVTTYDPIYDSDIGALKALFYGPANEIDSTGAAALVGAGLSSADLFKTLKFSDKFRDLGIANHYGLNIELDSASKIMWTWNCGVDVEFALGNAGVRLGWMMSRAFKKLETVDKPIKFTTPSIADHKKSIAEQETSLTGTYLYDNPIEYDTTGGVYKTAAGKYLTASDISPALDVVFKDASGPIEIGTYSPKFSLLSPTQHTVSLSVFYTF